MNGKVVKLYFRRGAIFALFLPLLLAGQSTALSADSQAVDERIDREQLLRDLQILSSDSLAGRRTGTAGHEKAQRYLAGRFREIGLHQFGPDYFQRFAIAAPGFSTAPLTNGPAPPDTIRGANLIGYLPGREDSSNVIVLSAHYDHLGVRNGAVYYGANDNASGMAGVLETARVLSQYRFPASILYVGLSGEEQGLNGGEILARHALAQGWHLQAVVNNDMIGNIRGINGVVNNSTARVFSEGTRYVETQDEATQRRFQGGELDSASRNLARYIDTMADLYVPNLDVMMVYRLDRFGRGGHHRPFNEVGLPAVRIMETNENYHWQHQDVRVENGIAYGDVIEHVDFDYAAKLTALNAVTLASMAWAPAPPTQVSIRGQVSPDTTLSWQKVPGAAAYRVHWRLTTDAQWTHSRSVGNVDSFTLENVVIDNYFFGVSSVSEDGLQSPVVFPGPAGAF